MVVAVFVGVVLLGEDGEMSAFLTSEFRFSRVSGCELCGVAEIDASEVEAVFSVSALSEMRVVSEAAGWLWGVLGFSVAALSELLEQFAASSAVRLSRQKARKSRGNSRSIDI